MMDCLTYSQSLSKFKYIINGFGIQNGFAENITIPLSSNVSYREIAHRLIEMHKLPDFIQIDLIEKLKNFIDDESDIMHDKRLEDMCQQSDIYAETNFNPTHLISDNDKTDKSHNWSESDRFSMMYHELIHSGILTESLIKYENYFSLTVQDLILTRDRAYNDLLLRQTSEMETAIKNIETTFSEDYINTLSAKHFEESEKLRDEWNLTIKNLKQEQKQEFRDWICSLYEEYKNGNPEMIATHLRNLSMNSCERFNLLLSDQIDHNSRMEESFTINLGTQLKTTHNLRLISMDILSLCRQSSIRSDFVFNTPHRIQTAMSLYSNSLSSLVLLVDNRINSYSGIKLEFANICSSSTEFHFDELQTQMEEARRMAEMQNTQLINSKSSNLLKTGDFYITKHSNLSEVHVVYHLVSDDSLRSADINSRHAVILGLRNIMKIAHLNDVNTITIPLLLIHEMAEEFTIQWCLKRAELVLKCVKGFMIELASFSHNDDNKTVQFVVPKNISQELFLSLTAILPSIFRLSNPLVLRSN